MIKFFKNLARFNGRKENNIDKVTRKEIKENMKTLESLRDYDAGKKEISTGDIERLVQDIQHTARR